MRGSWVFGCSAFEALDFMISFFKRPSTLCSGSDILGPRTLESLRDSGVEADLSDLWPDSWTRWLYESGVPLGKTVLNECIAPVALTRHLRCLGRGQLVCISGASRPWDVECRFERGVLDRGCSYLFHVQDDWLSIPFLRQQLEARLALASLVVVPTLALKERIEEHAPGTAVEVWEEPVDIQRLIPLPGDGGPPLVVWCGVPHSLRWLESIRIPLERVFRHTPFRLRLVCGNRRPRWSVAIPWEWRPYDPSTEAGALAGAVAGLAPLDDTPYSRCKGSYRVKTYMACGIPVIASDVGIHREGIESGKTGFRVRSPQEWEDVLMRLMADIPLRDTMGQRGREHAIVHFSHDAIIPQWVNSLRRRFPDSVGVGSR